MRLAGLACLRFLLHQKTWCSETSLHIDGDEISLYDLHGKFDTSTRFPSFAGQDELASSLGILYWQLHAAVMHVIRLVQFAIQLALKNRQIDSAVKVLRSQTTEWFASSITLAHRPQDFRPQGR